MKLKICGITNKEDLLACLPYVDAVGFIVECPQSKRNISIKKAKALIDLAPPFVTTVVVITDINKAKDIYEALHPDVVQLHGNETVEAVKNIRKKIPCKIMKACGVSEASKFSPYVDALLIDDKYGIYNYNELNKLIIDSHKPIIIAGHISPNNIFNIIHKIRPYGIDIASGVEKKPGKKDIKKIIQIKNALSLGPVVSSIVSKKKKHPSFSLYKAISSTDSISVIAEIKPSSPSEGILVNSIDDQKIEKFISIMNKNGVKAISVLVEEEYFNGNIELLKMIRKRTSLPIIAKGFFYTPEQICELAQSGANAFLLMSRVVTSQGVTLYDLISVGVKNKMDAMVEVATEEELDQAIRAGANIIEINNRDIYGDLRINFSHISLAKKLPNHILLISASGIKRPDQIDQILHYSSSRIHAILIGTGLMKSKNSGQFLRDVVKKGKEVYQ
jgi:indole-3-glycerol phosphate synthase